MNNLGTRKRSLGPLLSCTVLACCGLALSGCLAGPTYGTGTGAHEQLLEDVSGMLSIGPKDEERIEYKPRAQLVQPASTEVLPPPQESIVTASNEAWPESPEARRQRVRAEATLNRDDPGYRPEVAPPELPEKEQPVMRTRGGEVYASATTSASNQRAEFNRRLAISQQGSPTTRRYLSEPPLDYREPAASAPVGDVGEDEWKKEKRLKREARKDGERSWRDLIPWLD